MPDKKESLAYFLLCLLLLSCATTTKAPDPRVLTKQVAALAVECHQAVENFSESPTLDKRRREVLQKLKALNSALSDSAEYEREARSANSVDLVNANRAFWEAGQAWGNCSLEYNQVLVAVGEREAADFNYQGLLARLTGPQFFPITRKVRAAREELRRLE